jgi:hypothetical protein
MDFNNFYTMVTIIAIVLLIFALAFIGWTMSKQKAVDEYPKLHTTCPDFWAINSDGNCERPGPTGLNRGGETTDNATFFLGASGVNGNSFSSRDAGWGSTGNAICGKQTWANSQGITWDTVTNANFC